jgi:iron complex outermembrane recepter protein
LTPVEVKPSQTKRAVAQPGPRAASAPPRRASARPTPARPQNAPAGPHVSDVPNPPLGATGDGSRGYVATQTTVGTKTNTPLIETPQSISVVTQDQLKTQDPQSVKDALLYTAGVAADTRTSLGGYDIVYSRGFILDRFWDEMKILGGNNGFTVPQVDPYTLQRIEVLRGPTSVIYGYNSPGGILNLVSKTPTWSPYHQMEVQTGSFGRMQGAFDFSGPVDPASNLSLRMVGLAREVGNQVDFTKAERYLFAPSLTWRPTERTTLTLLTYLQQDPHLGLFNFVPAQGSVLANQNGKIPVNFFAGDPNYNTLNREQAAIGYLFEHQFSDDFLVRQKVRYVNTEGVLRQALPLFLDTDERTLFRFTQYDKENINAVTNDNQVQARFYNGAAQHTVLVGFDYSRLSEDDRLGQDFASPIDVYNPVYYQPFSDPQLLSATNQVLIQSGVYAQDQIKIDRLVLTLSGRRDRVTNDTFDVLAHQTTTQLDHATTERFGGTYVLPGGIAPYASFATSFQPVSGVDAQSKPFVPTTGTQREAGLKYQPPGLNLLFTFAAYDLVQQNVLTTDPNNPVFSVQTGEIESRGIEFETKASLAAGLDAIATYTAQSVKVTKANDVSKFNPGG